MPTRCKLLMRRAKQWRKPSNPADTRFEAQNKSRLKLTEGGGLWFMLVDTSPLKWTLAISLEFIRWLIHKWFKPLPLLCPQPPRQFPNNLASLQHRLYGKSPLVLGARPTTDPRSFLLPKAVYAAQ